MKKKLQIKSDFYYYIEGIYDGNLYIMGDEVNFSKANVKIEKSCKKNMEVIWKKL